MSISESAHSRYVDREDCRAGDWIEVDTPGGEAPRRGLVLDVLGGPGHTHFHVRWDEEHESLFYPADGLRITRPRRSEHRRQP